MDSPSDNNNSELSRTNTTPINKSHVNWADATDDWDISTPSSPTVPPTNLALIIEEQKQLPPITAQLSQKHTDKLPPTQLPTQLPANERWTLAKIIAIHPHSITFVEHHTGSLLKARPQSFATTLPNGKRSFVNIPALNLRVGDILECRVSDSPWRYWNPLKGGKDIKGWVLESIPQHNLVLHNGTIPDTNSANRIAFSFNAIVQSSGNKFTILHNISHNNTPIHGLAFCHFSKIPPSKVGTTVKGIAIPFQHKSTHFIVSNISSIL